MIKEIIVVEGKNDIARVRSAIEVDCLATNGYSITQATWQKLTVAYERRGLIIFTDPDSAGRRIRDKLASRFPAAKHAYLSQRQAIKDGKLGIELAEHTDIVKALMAARCCENTVPLIANYTSEDLFAWGLAGNAMAAQRRRALAENLNLNYANAKGFLKQLNGYAIERETLLQALELI